MKRGLYNCYSGKNEKKIMPYGVVRRNAIFYRLNKEECEHGESVGLRHGL